MSAEGASGAEQKGARVSVALVGRPNAGKSSLYNALTGGSARVGNYPGITVDILEAEIALPSGVKASLADLPGLYSAVAAVAKDTDEGVARTFIDGLATRGQYVVVQVADPTRLALGLRLTKELVAEKHPLVLVLTHADILRGEGRTIDVDLLKETLGIPVVLVSARDAGAKSTVFAEVDDLLRAHGDARDDVRERDDGPYRTPKREDERAGTAEFDPVDLAKRATKTTSTTRANRTERLDALLLHPILGPFLFLGLMALLFAIVFLVADPASGAMDAIVGAARAWFGKALANHPVVASFITDGLLGGAGTVLAFMPQIVILTIALEILEASGYLARGAFLVDRVLRLLGLSGRSFLPLLMGHACAIPAISATRVVRDPRERLTTILVLPLMTCSARLPTYGLVLAAFFSDRSALFRAGLFVGLYFAGILSGLLASWVLRRTATKGKGLPLVLEMPSYRVPQASVIARKAWRASKRFLRDVGTTIMIASAALWILLTIPVPGSTPTERPIDTSLAAWVGHAAEPVTRPAGFDWRINVGLIGSFGARELMVGTLGVINGLENVEDDPGPLATRLREAKNPDGSPVYTTRSGLALLAFFVLACQCMSTVAAIRRETSSWKWPAFVVAYTYALGYAAAVLVYQLGGILGIA